MHLLLFDIDGTLLIGAADAHRDAMHEALRDVYGVDPTRARVDPAGRTDMDIARAILLQCGVAAGAIDARGRDFRIACCEAYARLVPESLADRVAPGMQDVLETLAGRDDVLLSLVTGNFEPIARLKLGRAGIGEHFAAGQGGFGSDHEDRTLLPEVARRRAGADGSAWPRERTIVIGDTPRDVACARADGVRCLGVATGSFSHDELTGADVVVGHAGELLAALERLFAGS